MSDPHDRSTSRRRFLALAGSAAATTALAGCSGGGGDGGDNGSGGDNASGGGGATEGADTTAEGQATTGGGTEGGESTGTEAGNESSGNESEGGSPTGEFAVTITQGQPPSTLDPQNHRETPTDNVVLHAYEGVLARDREGKIVQKLATDYERVEEGRVRFAIQEGVTFHNGDDLTPEDVAFSINRIVKEDVGFASPQADQLPGVTGAEVVDGERAVEVTSDGFNPIVFASFATYCDVMEKSWVEERSREEIAQNMNGTGPFRLESYEQGVRVALSRYEDYWREPADVSRLTFNAAEESSTRVNQLLEGETDVAVNVPPQDAQRVRSSDGAGLSAVPSTRVIYNAMRYDVEPFSSPQFRRAMNYAVNLQGIIDNVLSGFADPTGQPTLEGFFGYNGDIDPYPQDRDRAESLVEESGFAGAEITLHTPVGRYLKDVEIAQAVVSQIDSLSNVSCSINQREFSTLAGELTDGDITTSPEFYLIGWGNATFDASQTIIPLLTSDGALTSYSNEELDSLIADAQSTSDTDQRDSLLQEANALINEQAPWIFLNRQYSVYGVSNRVEWSARRDERISAYAMSETS
jgi:peptide/nickel transport system substrate-binding protein